MNRHMHRHQASSSSAKDGQTLRSTLDLHPQPTHPNQPSLARLQSSPLSTSDRAVAAPLLSTETGTLP
ncbi:hypothetical protein CBOM_07855 [Ceraceosorus bombacis]|uniref:Uncharacterized protein n=1 Tax=Ceraceosorus bombacis TaxID=401625 RepID=A0A0P1BQW1_9BASI|nr:hypothetical protein CBOM_07855 [Ceraceosorus bombacis]